MKKSEVNKGMRILVIKGQYSGKEFEVLTIHDGHVHAHPLEPIGGYDMQYINTTLKQDYPDGYTKINFIDFIKAKPCKNKFVVGEHVIARKKNNTWFFSGDMKEGFNGKVTKVNKSCISVYDGNNEYIFHPNEIKKINKADYFICINPQHVGNSKILFSEQDAINEAKDTILKNSAEKMIIYRLVPFREIAVNIKNKKLRS